MQQKYQLEDSDS